MKTADPKIPETLESPPLDPSAPPKLFDDASLYKVSQIAERLNCSEDTVDRHIKRHGLKAVRFGVKQYFGRHLNDLLARMWAGEGIH